MVLKLGVEKRFLNLCRITYVRQGSNDMKVKASVLLQMLMQGSEVFTEGCFIPGDISSWHKVIVCF